MTGRLTMLFLAAALHLFAAPVSAIPQSVSVTLPDTVSSFALAGTEVLESGDLHLRYVDAEGQRADLYIYSPDAILLKDAAADSVVLDREAAGFVEGLKYGNSRGWWETYSMVVEPEPVTANTAFGEMTGRKSAFVFRRRGRVFVSVMYLFLVNDEFMKSRVSLPAEGWDQTDKSQFGLQVIEALTPKQ